MKRVCLIVLDSCGCGAMSDAAMFGDVGTHTLRSCFQTGQLHVPTMQRLGLGRIAGLEFLKTEGNPTAAYGRMAEASNGKDTTTGHWELAGLISEKPMPTYPNGFPADILAELEKQTGRHILCNRPYSGTDVIRDYGDEHVKTGDLIVYTSADSVCQIAAHEAVVPVETLYEYCRVARRIFCGEHAVGRIIARPFMGESGNYTRTANRRDFSLEPPERTVLNALVDHGKEVVAVGKITDIFAGNGVTRSVLTHSNAEGMQAAQIVMAEMGEGLCFVNLVDFDMLYGHRNNAAGYTNALNAFDAWLDTFLPTLRADDLLIITADHGCDPGDVATDHTREYVPLLMYGGAVKDLGTRCTFADVAATIAAYLNVEFETVGVNLL